MSSHRGEATALARKLKREGFSVKITGTGHWEVRHGKHLVTVFSCSPSDHRWKQNAEACVNRWKAGQQGASC